MHFKPLGNNILIKKLHYAREGLIQFPQISDALVNIFCGLILDVGDKVKDTLVTEHRVCFFDRKQMVEKLNKELYLFKEDSILLIKDLQGVFRPLGRRVLIERDIEEKTKIITMEDGRKINFVTQLAAYPNADQSLHGYIYRYGCINGNIIQHEGTNIGDKVYLKTWDMSIMEIGLEDKYLLSVPMKLLCFKEETIKDE